MGEHEVEMTLTDLEWEVINQALRAPIRDYLFVTISGLGVHATNDEIEAAWESVEEKFQETW